MKFFTIALLAACLLTTIAAQRSTQRAQPITVYRTASCGCCAKWVDHIRAAGFEPTVHLVPTTDNVPPRKGMPDSLHSCHTATLEGYTLEGHVPADVIKQLLKERPKIVGVAVPGMPAGSPGMESPYPQKYEVIAYDASGKTSVFARR
jgi:hypothetical protein